MAGVVCPVLLLTCRCTVSIVNRFMEAGPKSTLVVPTPLTPICPAVAQFVGTRLSCFAGYSGVLPGAFSTVTTATTTDIFGQGDDGDGACPKLLGRRGKPPTSRTFSRRNHWC